MGLRCYNLLPLNFVEVSLILFYGLFIFSMWDWSITICSL
jgi:hypothetical protein